MLFIVTCIKSDRHYTINVMGFQRVNYLPTSLQTHSNLKSDIGARALIQIHLGGMSKCESTVMTTAHR